MTGSPQPGHISCGLNTCPPTAPPRPARVPCRGEKNIHRTLCNDGRDGWKRSCTYRIPRRGHRRVRSGCGPVELRSLDRGRRNRPGAWASQKVTLTVYFKIGKVNSGSCHISLCGLSRGRRRIVTQTWVGRGRVRLALFPENGFARAVGFFLFSPGLFCFRRADRID